MDSVVRHDSTVRFHWTWTGTNTGPSGTGKAVHISGFEEWTLTPTGLIAQSLGHYDDAEYRLPPLRRRDLSVVYDPAA